MVVFDFVARRRRTAGVEGPLFNIFEAGDIVPSGEFFGFCCAVVTSCWDPEATEHSSFVTVDVACAGATGFWVVFCEAHFTLEVWFGRELLTALFFSDWGVSERRSDENLFGLKSHLKISRMS
jgi:hypothetical protein